ncbi:hypothetical protein SAMN05660211_04227 [Enterocloster clostridioformis]|nr:hypothetical protein SAMN05660211_04227 [Enterocloster clostridioformis]
MKYKPKSLKSTILIIVIVVALIGNGKLFRDWYNAFYNPYWLCRQ